MSRLKMKPFFNSDRKKQQQWRENRKYEYCF